MPPDRAEERIYNSLAAESYATGGKRPGGFAAIPLTATPMPLASLSEEEAVALPDVRVDPGQQDAYWSSAFAAERYFRPGCDYEDYAPAYCVGYVGYVQYRAAWDDALASLRANWERIKGASRLTPDEALAAIRAAWERMAGEAARTPHDT